MYLAFGLVCLLLTAYFLTSDIVLSLTVIPLSAIFAIADKKLRHKGLFSNLLWLSILVAPLVICMTYFLSFATNALKKADGNADILLIFMVGSIYSILSALIIVGARYLKKKL